MRPRDASWRGTTMGFAVSRGLCPTPPAAPMVSVCVYYLSKSLVVVRGVTLPLPAAMHRRLEAELFVFIFSHK